MKVAKIIQTMTIECILPLDADDEEELVDGKLPEDKLKELENKLRVSHSADAHKAGAKLAFFGIDVVVSDV